MRQRIELAEICNRVYDKEFVAGYDGNLSVKLDNSNFLVTPSAKCKGEIRPEDLLVVDINGRLIEGNTKPSTEIKIHLSAYQKREDVNAVIHCHPPYATAFAAIGEGFTRPVFPEVILTLGKVPLCRYATPSTEEMVLSIEKHLEYAWAMLLENHGAVTFGKDLPDAYFKMEKLEHTAKVIAIARSIGREKSLPNLKVKELYDIAETTYNIKINKKNRFDF